MKKAIFTAIGFLVVVALALRFEPKWQYTMPLPQGIGTFTITTFSGLAQTAGVMAVLFYFWYFRGEWRALRDSVPWPQRRRDYLDINYFGFVLWFFSASILQQSWVALSDGAGSFLMQHIARSVPVEAWAHSPMLFIRDACMLVLVVPTLEEIGFRAILYKKLKGLMGTGGAALLSSLVFALCHPLGLGSVAWYFVLGLMFCWMYQTEGILCAIIVHTGVNAFMFMTFYGLYHIQGVPLP